MKRRVKYLLIPLLLCTALLLFLLSARYSFDFLKTNMNNTSANSDRECINTEAKDSIVFSFGGTDIQNSVKNAISLFEKSYPAIKVKYYQLPPSTNLQKDYYTTVLHSGDDRIDVFLADIIWTAEFAANGWIMPLDDLFTESMQGEFVPNMLECCKYKGKIYAVPGKMDIPMLYYRSDIIAYPPKTIEELIELSKLYREENDIKYGFVFPAQSYEGLVCTALEFIWNNGGVIFSNDIITINSPEAIEGLQQLIDIVNSDVATTDVLNFQEDDARIAFQDGNALFMRNWQYAYNRMALSNSKVVGKYRVTPLPIGPKGRVSMGCLGGANLMINNKSRNKELAWELVKWITSHEMQLINMDSLLALPTRKNIYDSPGFKEKNPWIREFTATNDIISNTCLRPLSPRYSSISESLQTNFSNAIRRNISAKTAIENIENDLIHIHSLDKD